MAISLSSTLVLRKQMNEILTGLICGVLGGLVGGWLGWRQVKECVHDALNNWDAEFHSNLRSSADRLMKAYAEKEFGHVKDDRL